MSITWISNIKEVYSKRRLQGSYICCLAAIRPCHTAAILSLETKKLCFTTQCLALRVLIARLCVVKQGFFGLPGQYGRRVTKANGGQTPNIGDLQPFFTIYLPSYCPRAILLAMITMRKSIHGFPFLSHDKYGAPLGFEPPELR